MKVRACVYEIDEKKHCIVDTGEPARIDKEFHFRGMFPDNRTRVVTGSFIEDQGRPRVLVESPFKGDRLRNRRYLDAIFADVFARGEAPFASHALYTLFLDDDVPEERTLGIECGLAWGRAADLTAVYVDLGITEGMQIGMDRAHFQGRPVERRSISAWAERVQCMGFYGDPTDNRGPSCGWSGRRAELHKTTKTCPTCGAGHIALAGGEAP